MPAIRRYSVSLPATSPIFSVSINSPTHTKHFAHPPSLNGQRARLEAARATSDTGSVHRLQLATGSKAHSCLPI
nr:unnamed protein product [Digitaria exilis]